MVGRTAVWEASVLDPSPEVYVLGDFEKVIRIKKASKPLLLWQRSRREKSELFGLTV